MFELYNCFTLTYVDPCFYYRHLNMSSQPLLPNCTAGNFLVKENHSHKEKPNGIFKYKIKLKSVKKANQAAKR